MKPHAGPSPIANISMSSSLTRRSHPGKHSMLTSSLDICLALSAGVSCFACETRDEHERSVRTVKECKGLQNLFLLLLCSAALSRGEKNRSMALPTI